MALNQLGIGIVLEAKDLFSGAMNKAGRSFVDFEGKASAAGKAIEGHMRGLTLGLGIFAAGLGGLALLGAPTEAAKLFGQGITEITTLTDEASLSFGNLEDVIIDLNAAYGGGTAKQIKGTYDGISAGASNAAQAIKLLNASNKLAVAGKTDVSTAVDGLTSSLNAYGVSFEKASTFSDTFFVAVQQGKTTIPELSHVIGRVAPTASALGISFDELGAALASVTTKGLKTEEAATGIKAAFANIIQPAHQATQEAARLGIKFDQTALKTKGGLKGLLDSITSAKGFNSTSLSKLFTSMEGLNAVLALTAGGGSKFAEALDAMKGGAADKAFGKMSETLAFQSQRFQGLKENVTILIGQALEPAAMSVTRFANRVLTAFQDAPIGMRSFIVQGFATLATLLTVVGGALTLVSAFGMLKAGLVAAGVSMSGFLAVLAPIVAGLAVVTLAVTTFRFAIDRNLGGLGDAVHAGVAKAKLAFDALAQLFQDGGISGKVRDDLNSADNMGLKNFVVRVFLTVSRVQEAFDNFVRGFRVTLHEAEPAFKAFGDAVGELGQQFSSLWETNDPADAQRTFGEYATTGEKIGKALGKAAVWIVEASTSATKAITKIVEVAKGLEPVGGAVLKVVDAMGGLKTIAFLVEMAMVAMIARSTAAAAVAMWNLASGAGSAAVALGRTAVQFVVMNGFSITSMASSAAAGLRGLAVAATTSLGPIGAIALAIGGLYLAWTQLTALMKEWDENSLSQMWTAFKQDIGVTSAADNEKAIQDKARAAFEASEAKRTPAMFLPPASIAAPAASQVAASATVASNAAQEMSVSVAAPEVNVSVSASVAIDGEELSSSVQKVDRRVGDRTARPGIPVSG